ncbi:hypothetical protein [Streptomyces sp. NPDC051665]|uniref:hypothetical protein n=1 Tax=Streptomyces sp. NPDC051665 TaxID=3154647 RepID=UPI00343BF064
MPRTYTMSEAAKAARKKNSALAYAPSRLIAKLEERADELTLEDRDRLLGIVVRDEPNRDAPAGPETLAEIRRLLGGASR